ncbi:MAG: hypothetical protein NXY57DRAFT_996422 [Lentinula lateritia]|nr:MAG: hypothetical protein NXY57DRAFT_996422 [Lentinula lateritia]
MRSRAIYILYRGLITLTTPSQLTWIGGGLCRTKEAPMRVYVTTHIILICPISAVSHLPETLRFRGLKLNNVQVARPKLDGPMFFCRYSIHWHNFSTRPFSDIRILKGGFEASPGPNFLMSLV